MKTILCVEDGRDDIVLLRIALEKSHLDCHLAIVMDIQAAQDYLRGEGEYADRELHPWPSLVVSDMKLPGGSGLDLVAWIRKRHSAVDLPVIIMTGFVGQVQYKCAEAGGANFCVPKSSGFQELIEKIRLVLE